MVKTNLDATGKQCIRNDNGVPAVSDEDMKIPWKSCHEKLLNTEFPWDRNSLSHTDIVSSVPWHGQRVRNGKKRDAWVDIITDLVNQIS